MQICLLVMKLIFGDSLKNELMCVLQFLFPLYLYELYNRLLLGKKNKLYLHEGGGIRVVFFSLVHLFLDQYSTENLRKQYREFPHMPPLTHTHKFPYYRHLIFVW